ELSRGVRRPRAARDQRRDPLRVDVAHRQVDAVTQQVAGQLATDVPSPMKPMRTAVGYFQNSSAGIAKLIPCASRMDSEVIPIRFPCASNSPPPDEPREIGAVN